jgi:CheY-like chemotaxis protein
MNDILIQGPRPNILIVDDAPENLDVLVGILKNTGYTVRPVTNAEAALQAALKKAPDVFLLDIHMPGMDGPTLCATLKESRQLSDIPVIFISGSTGPDDIRKAFSAGGADYIIKPFQSEEVLARVKTQLELRFLRLELERYKKKFGVIHT